MHGPARRRLGQLSVVLVALPWHLPVAHATTWSTRQRRVPVTVRVWQVGRRGPGPGHAEVALDAVEAALAYGAGVTGSLSQDPPVRTVVEVVVPTHEQDPARCVPAAVKAALTYVRHVARQTGVPALTAAGLHPRVRLLVQTVGGDAPARPTPAGSADLAAS